MADPTYEADQAEKLRHNAIGSNLLRMVDDYLCVDDLAYHAPQKIREIPYAEGKRRIAELEGAFARPRRPFICSRWTRRRTTPASWRTRSSSRRPTPLPAAPGLRVPEKLLPVHEERHLHGG